MGELHQVALQRQLGDQWEQIMTPWLQESQLTSLQPLPALLQTAAQKEHRASATTTGDRHAGKGITRGTGSVHSVTGEKHLLHDRSLTDEPVAAAGTALDEAAGRPPGEEAGMPEGTSPSDGVEEVHKDVMPARPLSPARGGSESRPVALQEGHHHPRELKDLVRGDVADRPWQFKKYAADNAVWQGAALRRRMHHRRTNVSLGVCAVDLSGPHEPTPRPGGQIAKDPCHYFLALSVRPDDSAARCDVAVQTSGPEEPSAEGSGEPVAQKQKPVLIYAALLGAKSEASDAVKHLLAQCNNDHANFPTEIIFRVHSDLGTEFMNEDLQQYCAHHGIHKTSTAGYDPNANSAESTVGTLKRRGRYLLSCARLPTSWWGLATLAAAQLCRADAGIEKCPRILLEQGQCWFEIRSHEMHFCPEQSQQQCSDLAVPFQMACGHTSMGLSSAERTWQCRG